MDSTFVLCIGAGIGLTALGIISFNIWEDWNRKQQIEAVYRTGSAILLTDFLVKTDQIRRNRSSINVESASINYRAHEILEEAPKIIPVSGQFTSDKIMDLVASEPYADRLRTLLDSVSNLYIWDRVFIHDRSVGLIDLRTENGNDTKTRTICFQV